MKTKSAVFFPVSVSSTNAMTMMAILWTCTCTFFFFNVAHAQPQPEQQPPPHPVYLISINETPESAAFTEEVERLIGLIEDMIPHCLRGACDSQNPDFGSNTYNCGDACVARGIDLECENSCNGRDFTYEDRFYCQEEGCKNRCVQLCGIFKAYLDKLFETKAENGFSMNTIPRCPWVVTDGR